MASRKDPEVKERLIGYAKRNRSVPIWVIAKTNRRYRSNPHRYHWRRSKLGLEIEYSIEESKGER